MSDVGFGSSLGVCWSCSLWCSLSNMQFNQEIDWVQTYTAAQENNPKYMAEVYWEPLSL